MMKNFSKIEKKLDIKFKDKNLLMQAFCHRSYLNENPKCDLENNERLEFLGDAVLELVVTEYLYKNYKESEGQLTNWRAALVNSQSLAEIAEELGFNDYILLSRGEAKDTGKARQSILANAFEAFLGALYLDQGLRAVRNFINKYLIKKLSYIVENGLFRDAKSFFQEIAQKEIKITPEYKVLEEAGPDHAKEFTIGVFLGDKLIAKGKGSSKQEAEEKAARNALKVKNW
ncbi:ribonuclease III [bacterium (Candidatus Gribaldobacteria) CG_4_9_14_3_um_filter_36_15]|uniref:Ribonuclease 3 n=3 Tax=Candidatus Gribaldobacteria TaxID=2798536 RepID=A0A2H0UX87_9BACT|nr:MAG: ribonuclease III [bacterium (Candidatus Gribaldobacteria) CG10_big_fil_rev_8_21_14_0_10_37_46]PIV14081.1 MAG: ribonuclease III [bacterium (Candidatus Gribaldobacteria) CG03_land_8_20_14_0_80_36_40]PJB09402.1 MAG: ribonuclease III [bacterium (Candidatus Gribaldobacteria) CG_4_9_14_3_um_filter_36_15]